LYKLNSFPRVQVSACTGLPILIRV
jgi:hypothetical protein